MKKKENYYFEAIKFTLGTSYFHYENDFNLQIDGLAMESPISSVFAQFSMKYSDENVTNNFQGNILTHKRYVENYLLITSDTDFA